MKRNQLLKGSESKYISMVDSSDIIVNEHTSDKPGEGIVISAVIGFLIMFLGCCALGIAGYLVDKHPNLERVIWVTLALFCAGAGQWTYCFLTRKR